MMLQGKMLWILTLGGTGFRSERTRTGFQPGFRGFYLAGGLTVIVSSTCRSLKCAFLALRGSLAMNVETEVVLGGAKNNKKFRGGGQEKQNSQYLIHTSLTS